MKDDAPKTNIAADRADKEKLVACQHCLCLASRRAARAITRAFDRRLRPLGIRATQFSILVALVLGGPVAIGTLAGWLGIERTTLTRNLDLLESKGWIEVEAAPGDARSRIVAITESGRAMARTVLPVWQDTQESVIAAIGDAGYQSLHTLAGTPLG